MSGLKRNASSRSMKLTAQPSPHNATVTLFKAEDVQESPDSPSPRRSKRVKLEAEPLVDLEDAVKISPGQVAAAAGPSTKSPRKSKLIPQSLKNPHPAPERWRETYDTIKSMRSRITAPVDTMGCDQAQLKETDPKNQRFATLVSLMLSSQTKDEVTDAAVSKLRDALGGSITVDAMRQADNKIVSDAIGKVGFWRRKTDYLKQTAQRLYDEFDSDVPKTVDELCSLPGVGPKMAFLALQVAWNLNFGIGVDVHVHRITNRLGWHRKATKNPEETRLNLQSWLPTELHAEINHMLVGFGQMVCLPTSPRCDLCDLSSKGLCPSARKVINTKNRKTVFHGPKIEVEASTPEAGEMSPPAAEIPVSKGD